MYSSQTHIYLLTSLLSHWQQAVHTIHNIVMLWQWVVLFYLQENHIWLAWGWCLGFSTLFLVLGSALVVVRLWITLSPRSFSPLKLLAITVCISISTFCINLIYWAYQVFWSFMAYMYVFQFYILCYSLCDQQLAAQVYLNSLASWMAHKLDIYSI